MKKILAVLVGVGVLLGASGLVLATTEALKQAAIDAGLAHLAGTQQVDGSWYTYWGWYNPAGTAAALLAFQDHGYLRGATGYNLTVAKGLDYLFSTATKSGNQVWWSGEDTYQTGLALGAIATAGASNKTTVVTVGPCAGMTYAQVAQDVVNYFAAGQIPAGNPYGWAAGGWGYGAYPYTRPDNSTSQWPVVGMAFAESRGYATVPGSVKTNLIPWITYIQNPDGGSDYDKTWGSDEARTGGLLLEMDWAGGGGNMASAIAYLNARWLNGASGWNGNFGQPYAMWSIYKGLESTIGLNTVDGITNLHAPAPMDTGDTWNWWEDYCDWLVNNQNPNGSWSDYSGYGYWGDPLSTAWNVNILLATQVTNVIPEPMTMAGVLLGLGCVVRYIRRRG